MSENQNLEYKETWRDEYLKWICGFANADGGKLYIGIDDSGHIVGVDKAKNFPRTSLTKYRTPSESLPT